MKKPSAWRSPSPWRRSQQLPPPDSPVWSSSPWRSAGWRCWASPERPLPRGETRLWTDLAESSRRRGGGDGGWSLHPDRWAAVRQDSEGSPAPPAAAPRCEDEGTWRRKQQRRNLRGRRTDPSNESSVLSLPKHTKTSNTHQTGRDVMVLLLTGLLWCILSCCE